MSSLDRLSVLIGVADRLLEEQKRTGHMNELTAILVAALIGRELHMIRTAARKESDA